MAERSKALVLKTSIDIIYREFKSHLVQPILHISMMMLFYNHFISLYGTYKYIIWIIATLMAINAIYYMYWIFFFTSIFQYYKSNVDVISLYTDTDHIIYTNMPVMEINISLFEIQSSIIIIIIWSAILIAPSILFCYGLVVRHIYHIKIYILYSMLAMLLLTTLVHLFYVPIIMNLSYESYKIFQIFHESMHINIEFQIIEIFEYILYSISIMLAVVAISIISNHRTYTVALYFLFIKFPIIPMIIGLCCCFIFYELSTFFVFIKQNYFRSIAGHCTGIFK